MNVNSTVSLPRPIIYPESDGKPMADNTKQLRWITVLYGNLSAMFRDRPDVLVAGDLFWYAVQDEPEERAAPDVLVVFGRPKGDRGSYKQWEEGGIPVTVAFEILSPSNTPEEMVEKSLFYERHGVEEYYCFNPDRNSLQIFTRRGEVFLAVRAVAKFVSPRLGIRFDLSGEEMVVYGPDGRKFLTYEELAKEHSLERTARLKAEQRGARMAELSRKARRGQATAEELHELEQLENECSPPPA
jgi:Uma2 family endonuclease